MKTKTKHIPIVLALGIGGLYLVLRLTNIMTLPIFTDEAIYVRWAQESLADPTQRFISLTDGKQPLFIWLGAPFLKLISEPLLAMRLLSVTTGLVTVAGIWFLTKELFQDKRTAYVASLVYLIYPFALISDRLALYDSLVATIAVWALYLQVLLVRRRQLAIALLLGLVLGAGLLTKSSAQFFIYMIPVPLLLMNFNHKQIRQRIAQWVLLVLLAVTMAYVISLILKLSPNAGIITDKNAVFVYSIREWIRQPFIVVFEHGSLLTWLVTYITLPGVVLAFLAFFVRKQHIQEKIVLTLWWLIPFAALAFFAKVLYPRYMFFTTVFLLPLIAYSAVGIWDRFQGRIQRSLLVLLGFGGMVACSILIIFRISAAPIP